jgi:hypothetical protein
MRATDAIIAALDTHAAKSLYAPGTVLGSRLTVVADDAHDARAAASRR